MSITHFVLPLISLLVTLLLAQESSVEANLYTTSYIYVVSPPVCYFAESLTVPNSTWSLPKTLIIGPQKTSTKSTSTQSSYSLATRLTNLHSLQTQSDLELQISDTTIIPAHSAVLVQKSLWFKDRCAESNRVDEQTVRLQDLDRDTFKHFFSPQPSIDDVRRETALTTMLLFCYTGSYRKDMPSTATEQEENESLMRLHMYEYLLARLYRIESLEAYSFERIKSEASALVAQRSEIYYKLVVDILAYPKFDAENPLWQFANRELKKLNDAEVQREYSCNNCHTTIQVTYLQRPGAAAPFVLEKCPNCPDWSDKDTVISPPVE